ncbi:MAG: TlpA disulfide reductase family protein [Paracoccaceae bacterium]
MRLNFLVSALLYAAVVAGANPSGAQSVDAAEREAILAMRSGDMRKMRILSEPLPAATARYFTETGDPLSLADSDGRFRLVNFWATWCGPCREEMPTLDALQRRMGGEDFQVMAIATGRNTLSGLKSFNAKNGITNLPILLDPKSELAREKGVLGLPVTVLLDRQGQEIARLQGGADWNSETAVAVLVALMAAADS